MQQVQRKFFHSTIAPYAIGAVSVLNIFFLKFSISYLYVALLVLFLVFLVVDYGIHLQRLKYSFLFYCLGVVSIFFITIFNAHDLSSIYLGGRGSMVYLLFPIYWLIYFMHFDEHDFWFMANIFVKTIGLLVALGGIVQYFYSQTLFGLYDEFWSKNFLYSSLYDDYKSIFRATSVLGSCQIYSLFLAFSIVYYLETQQLTYSSLKRFSLIKSNTIILSIFLIAGILSGAKSFIVLLFLYLVKKYFTPKEIVKCAFICVILFGLIELLPKNSEFLQSRVINRITSFSTIIDQENSNEGRLAIYNRLLEKSIQNGTVLSGDGPGSHMSLSALDVDNEHFVTESYLLQIYIELGLIVCFLFMFFISSSFFIKNKRAKILNNILFIQIVSMLFVHGFNSPFLFLFWAPFLIPSRQSEPFLNPSAVIS